MISPVVTLNWTEHKFTFCRSRIASRKQVAMYVHVATLNAHDKIGNRI